MNPTTRAELLQKTCRPCEGGVPPLSHSEAHSLVKEVPDWELIDDDRKIRRRWIARDFVSAIEFFGKVAQIAEEEGHHPDLHLEGYRNVTIVLWTHAIGGLSENDFILAAKIDEVPFALKPGRPPKG